MNKQTEHRILLLGATGRTGQWVLRMALDKGYAVTVLVRNPNKIQIKSDRLKIVKGLPTHIDDVRLAMRDCSYVVSLLSALSEKESFSFRKIVAPHTLEKTMKNVTKVMQENQIKRVMTLSSIGAGDSYRYAPWFMKLMIKITNFNIVFSDHDAQEQVLEQSGLDWTIARPVALNNDEMTGELVVTYTRTPKPFKMSRKLLATFFIDNLSSTAFIHKKPLLAQRNKV